MSSRVKNLRVGIQQDDVLAAQGQFPGDMRGERGLAYAAFLVEQGNDHGTVLRGGKQRHERLEKRLCCR